MCGWMKPTSEFSPRGDRRRGFASRCRDCCKSKRCADCGVPIWQGGTYCQHCRFKGERNPIYGTHRPEHVKAAVSKAQLGVPDPPRPIKRPSNAATGRGQANRLYAKPAVCEACGEPKRLDWHHIDSDPTNNERENLTALCRLCHQKVDGRHEMAKRGFRR